MSMLRFNLAMSLDGPKQGVENPLGIGGMRLPTRPAAPGRADDHRAV